jgi:type I restriction enzyme S subunit
MLVPRLRFKEFTDEWKRRKLIQTSEINPKNSFLPKKFIYIDLECVEKGILKKENIINGTEAPSRAQRLVKINDILFQTVRPYQKNNYFVKFLKEIPYIASSGYTLIRTKENPYFIYTILHQKKFVDKVLNLCTGTSFPAISSHALGSVEIIIPTLKEQEKIGNFISLLDKKIELQSKKVNVLKLYKKGLVLNLMKNRNEWSEYKVKDIFNITRGIVIPKIDLSEKSNDEYKYPVYSSQTFNKGILGYDNKYDFDGKYLTWTTDGANAGKVFFRNGKFRCTNVCGVLYENNVKYTNELVAELLNYVTPKHVSYVGNPKLMNNVMGEIKINLPKDELQISISRIINSFSNKIELENEKLEKLQVLKKGFMQVMFA